jgi:hypothetical protein
MANKDRHRRFGNVRKRESGRYQIRYPGPDGRMRTGSETYARKSDAERALTLTEAAIVAGTGPTPSAARSASATTRRAGSLSVRACGSAPSTCTRGRWPSTSLPTSPASLSGRYPRR